MLNKIENELFNKHDHPANTEQQRVKLRKAIRESLKQSFKDHLKIAIISTAITTGIASAVTLGTFLVGIFLYYGI